MPKLAIPESGRIECRVSIKPYDSLLMKDIKFKVDTGADFSTISKSALRDLGFSDDWIEENKEPVATSTTVASGEEVVSYNIRLPLINIYGIEGTDYPFGILMDKEVYLPKPTCKGCGFTEAKKLDYRPLLGNDILSCFKVAIDWDNKVVNLAPQSSLDKRNMKYPDRQLNFLEND